MDSFLFSARPGIDMAMAMAMSHQQIAWRIISDSLGWGECGDGFNIP
jgi:hypothetical protein